MATPTVTIRRVRRTIWVARRVPRSLRRPRRAVRIGLIGVGSWFAVFFLALGLGGTVPSTVSTAFVIAACTGLLSIALVGTGRVEPGIWSLGTMLLIGQAAALSLAW